MLCHTPRSPLHARHISVPWRSLPASYLPPTVGGNPASGAQMQETRCFFTRAVTQGRGAQAGGGLGATELVQRHRLRELLSLQDPLYEAESNVAIKQRTQLIG